RRGATHDDGGSPATVADGAGRAGTARPATTPPRPAGAGTECDRHGRGRRRAAGAALSRQGSEPRRRLVSLERRNAKEGCHETGVAISADLVAQKKHRVARSGA